MKPIVLGEVQNIKGIVVDPGANFWNLHRVRVEEIVLEEAFTELADRHRQLIRDAEVLGLNMELLDELLDIECRQFVLHGPCWTEANLVVIDGDRPFITSASTSNEDQYFDDVDGFTIDEVREVLDRFKNRHG